MSSAIDPSRSLAACLRCRKQKLKCGGPGQVPCQRCRRSNAECIFVSPKGIQNRTTTPEPSKIDRLEQRLNLVEGDLRKEIQDLKRTVEELSFNRTNLHGVYSAPSSRARGTGEIAPSTHLANKPTEFPSQSLEDANDVISAGIATEDEWNRLHDFFNVSCKSVVALFDENVFPPAAPIVRQHPLMTIVVCTIAARAIMPEKYQALLSKADQLIMSTFSGPLPHIVDFWAMMLLTAWTGRNRMWGYIASVGGEMKLNEAALQFGISDTEHPQDLVERARAWFALCCFDLQMNLSTPFVINRMKDYLQYTKKLLTSPHCRPVDYRICAYTEGFTIAGDVKAQFKSSQLRSRPLSQEVANVLDSFDEKVETWFHNINNDIDPLYQTFPEIQDRNRFMMPYAFLRLYVNGLALHSIESPADLNGDIHRITLIKRALDSASLLIQTQFESDTFRRGFRYTMDYGGTVTYRASSFILKALPVVYEHVDCHKHLTRLHQAAQMFEQAGAVGAASDLRRGQERLATLTQTTPIPALDHDEIRDDVCDSALFDIPNFLDEVTWDSDFPTLGMYMLN